jgi:hypothetical protein
MSTDTPTHDDADSIATDDNRDRPPIADDEAVTTTDRLLKSRGGRKRYHTKWCSNTARINDPQRRSRAALAADPDFGVCAECAVRVETTVAERHHDQAGELTRLADIGPDHDSLADSQEGATESEARYSAVAGRITGVLRERGPRLGQLPAPGQLYTFRAVDEAIEYRDWRWLTNAGEGAVLNDHGYAADHAEFGGREGVPGRSRHHTRHVWSTPPAVAEGILDVQRPEGHPHPCLADGHRGIRNLGDGRYSCTNDDCDRRFGRDVAEAIVEADTA